MRLEVGVEYIAIGPNPGAKPPTAGKTTSGWWDPPRCTVVSIDEDAGLYRTKGKGSPANVIMFKAAHHWRPANEGSLL